MKESDFVVYFDFWTFLFSTSDGAISLLPVGLSTSGYFMISRIVFLDLAI